MSTNIEMKLLINHASKIPHIKKKTNIYAKIFRNRAFKDNIKFSNNKKIESIICFKYLDI